MKYIFKVKTIEDFNNNLSLIKISYKNSACNKNALHSFVFNYMKETTFDVIINLNYRNLSLLFNAFNQEKCSIKELTSIISGIFTDYYFEQFEDFGRDLLKLSRKTIIEYMQYEISVYKENLEYLK